MIDLNKKYYFYYSAKSNECKIVDSNLIYTSNLPVIRNIENSMLNEKLVFSNPIENNDYLLEVPEKIKKHIFKDKLTGDNRKFSVLEEHLLYSFLLNSLNETKKEHRIISKLFLALILNTLGYNRSTKSSLKYVIKVLGKNNKFFGDFISNLLNKIPSKIPENFITHVTIVTSFKESDIDNKKAFGRLIELYNISEKLSIKKIIDVSELTRDNFIKEIEMNNKIDCLIFVGHGNKNSGLKLNFTDGDVEVDIKWLNQILNNFKSSQKKNLLILSCDSQFYGNNLDQIKSDNLGYAEGSITFEHIELFISVFLRMLNYNANYKDAFEWAKFSMLLKYSENSYFQFKSIDE